MFLLQHQGFLGLRQAYGLSISISFATINELNMVAVRTSEVYALNVVS